MPSGAPDPSEPLCPPGTQRWTATRSPGIWRVRDSWISRRPTATPSSLDRPRDPPGTSPCGPRRTSLTRARARVWRLPGGLSARVAFSLGGGFSRHEPSGTTLGSGMIGRIQPKLVAPELAFHAAAARAYAASATVLACLAQGATLVVRGRFDRSRPVDSVPGVGAERSLWSVSAGMARVGG